MAPAAPPDQNAPHMQPLRQTPAWTALEDHAAAILALTGAGAVRVDIGQRDVPWTVLADPEGSEFCVLSPR